MKKGWKKLRQGDIIVKGDRPLYVDGTMGTLDIPIDAIGYKVKYSGYIGVARKIKKARRKTGKK